MDILRQVPLGVYVPSPQGWLHRLDPRTKILWLLSVILSPILAKSSWRLGLVVGLLLLTWSALPWRVWRRQAIGLLLLSWLMFAIALLSPDALGVTPTPQRQAWQPPPDQATLVLPQPTHYRYELFNFHLGPVPLRASRRTLSLGIRIGTLVFTLFFVSSLFLLTTPPEAITVGLAHLLSPLQTWGIPIAEITLTTTLALRFLPLVLEEVQNLVRAVRTRDVDWSALGWRGTMQLMISLVDRLLENLLLRAAQTAEAMQVRGYVGPNHPIQGYTLRFQKRDYVALALLPLFWWLRLQWFGGSS
ncbi:MAG: energy-coupling factor transporter transmembrane protein EcfT [Thermostichales cyanobacterium GMQP_bins_62]